MPKGPTNSLFRNFFEKSTRSEQMVCQLEDGNSGKICGELIKNKLYNLKKHIYTGHNEVYDKTIKEEEDLDKKKNTCALNEDLSYYFSKTVKCTMSMHEFELLVCERVVKSGRPLSDFNDPAFRKFLQPYCNALGITVSNEYAKKIVIKMSKQLVDILKTELKEKPFHLMMDGSTRYATDYIAAGIQYFDEETARPKIAYLGVPKSTESQTGENIKACVDELFEKFELKHCQLISNTVDNGANYVKACKLLLEHAQADLKGT